MENLFPPWSKDQGLQRWCLMKPGIFRRLDVASRSLKIKTATPELLSWAILNDHALAIRCQAATNPDCPEATITKILNSPSAAKRVRSLILQARSLSATQWEGLLTSEMRRSDLKSILQNIYCPEDVIRTLAAKIDQSMFWYCTVNPNCPADVLAVAFQKYKAEYWCRVQVTRHKNLDMATFGLALEDPHPDVRAAAIKRI